MTTVPSVVRHGEYEDYPEGTYHHGSYAGDGHHGTLADDMGYTPTHGEHAGEPSIHIARSNSSHTGSQRSIRERGLGTAHTQTAKSLGVSRSASAAGYGRSYPVRTRFLCSFKSESQHVFFAGEITPTLCLGPH